MMLNLCLSLSHTQPHAHRGRKGGRVSIDVTRHPKRLALHWKDEFPTWSGYIIKEFMG